MSDADATPEVEDAAPAAAPNAVSVLTYVVKQVVDNPDAVSVSTTEGRRGGLQLDVRVGVRDEYNSALVIYTYEWREQ